MKWSLFKLRITKSYKVFLQVNSILKKNTTSSGQFASYGNVLDDIRSQSAGFQHVEFSYTSRVCNSVADALAKKAKSGVGFQVWLEDLPDDIAPFVFRDVH